jgi:hypothetical protein
MKFNAQACAHVIVYSAGSDIFQTTATPEMCKARFQVSMTTLINISTLQLQIDHTELMLLVENFQCTLTHANLFVHKISKPLATILRNSERICLRGEQINGGKAELIRAKCYRLGLLNFALLYPSTLAKLDCFVPRPNVATQATVMASSPSVKPRRILVRNRIEE